MKGYVLYELTLKITTFYRGVNMKRLIAFMLVLTAITCVLISASSCKKDEPIIEEKPPIYLSEESLTLNKGESATISVISQDKLDTLSIKWSATDTKVVSFEKDGVSLKIKGLLEGESQIKLLISGKVIDTIDIKVITPSLQVRLPSGKLVLSQNQVVTVTAYTQLISSEDAKWWVETDKITIESQNLIARVSILENCPNGEYKASVTFAGQIANFTIIVGK